MLPDALLKAFSDRAVLVTGGTGLIGRQVVDLLAATGARVTVASLDDLVVDQRAQHVRADLTSFETCKELTRGKDFVCHVAGIKGSIEVTRSKPASFFVPLLMMNTNLLEACRQNQVPRVVYTSSIGAYPSAEVFVESSDPALEGPPMDLYPGWAKRMGELQIQAYRTQYGLEGFSVVRPCNVYGPGDDFRSEHAMVIPSLMVRIRRGEDPLVIWGDGSAVRDFAFSRDVAKGVLLALHHGTGPTYVNLGSGIPHTLRELVETLQSFIPFRYRFDPTRPTGFPKRVMDIRRAREQLGFEPETSLRDGLEQTWRWYLDHHTEVEKRHSYFGS